MKRYLILFLLMINSYYIVHAQIYDVSIRRLISDRKFNEALNEIQKGIKHAENDTSRIWFELLKSVVYEKQGDFGTALSILKGIDIKKANTRELIQVYSQTGIYLTYLNQRDSGILYTKKAILLLEKHKYIDGKHYNNLSFMYQMKGDPFNQLKYALKAYRDFEKRQDSVGLVVSHYALGNYYFENNDMNLAESYLLRGLHLRKVNKALQTQAFAGFDQILAQIYEDRKDYINAMKYGNTALAIDLTLKNIQGLGLTNGLLGRFSLGMKKYKSALDYCRKGILLSDSSKMFNQTSEIYATQGDVYRAMGEDRMAILSYEKAMQLAKNLGLNKVLMSSGRALSDIYKKQKKYDKALYFAEAYKAANDSLISSENSKKSKFLLAQFEAEQKDKKILEQELGLAEQKVKNKQLEIWGLVIILLASIMAIALIYNRYSNRHKISEILNAMQENLYEFQDSIRLAFNQSPTELSLIQAGQGSLKELLRENDIKEFFLNQMEKTVLRNIKDQTYKISKELETRINNVKTFSYSISHDLRQPIRQALLLAEEGESGNAAISEIREYVKQANDLVDCYTALAEIEAYELDMKVINLGELVFSELKKLKKLDYFPKDCEINIGQLDNIWGDTLLVRQVLWNLLSNAIKYSSSREKVKVNICTEQMGENEVVISIRDNGIGFSPMIGDKLFLPFVREATSKKYSGFGIGLALCKQIMEKLGGRIWAISDGKTGATFFIAFRRGNHQLS